MIKYGTETYGGYVVELDIHTSLVVVPYFPFK